MTCKQRTALLLAILFLLGGREYARAAEVDCDSVYCFQDSDFAEDPTLQGVCITGLPDSAAGTVMLGTRIIRSGDILTAQQLSQLTFQPLRTEQDVEVTVTYLPIYETRVEAATTMTISIRGKTDQLPVAEDSALETYKNLANSGQLKAYDPEGDTLTYTVTRSPKRGDVVVNADGSYTYTPKKNKVGTDSFVYTVTDGAGNVSRATVTIEVLKPTAKTTYADTLGLPCRFAAEWMRNTGLFVGETIGNESCFQPEKTVTRGEFTAMLVRSLDIAVDENADYTGFTDDAPTWLRPYLSAAMRAGLTAGWGSTTFGANETITGAEAALMIQNALDLTVSASAMEAENVAIAVLAENGLSLPSDGMSRAQVAIILYQVSLLAPNSPGMSVFQ